MGRKPDRRHRRRQIEAARIARPEELVGGRHFVAIDEDGALMALALLVMREGGGRGGRAEQHVPLFEKRIPGEPHLVASLIHHQP